MKTILTGVTLVLLSALVLSPIVHASVSTTMTGTASVTGFTLTSIRLANGNTIVTGIETGVDTGDISGTFTGTATFIFHPDGSLNWASSGTETASVLGSAAGTFSWSASGTTTADGFDNGQFVIGHGSGSLAGIHGVMSLSTPVAFGPDDYSGQVHFDPS